MPSHSAWQQPELSHNLTPLKQPVKAEPFELDNLDEEPVKLSDYRGRVIMLNFWATWCPPCVREMPSMERLNRQFGKENFTVLALNQMEDEDQVFAFTGQLELEPTFTILFDKDSKVANQYGVRGLPTTYLIDKKGYIRYRAIGGRLFNHPEVLKIIRQLMDE
ncbi:MAG TPA: TlpA family protein disulfide reductase [Thiotrichales bacterium]|nr:TlpA family protein disulfide reductase [Thiotrichales bacterium]